MPPATSHASDHQGPLRVLILDDERFDRLRMSRLCDGLDVACKISHAANLVQFRVRLGEGAFDLILIDYALPDGTGLEALHQIKTSEHNMNAALIMVTGQDDMRLARDALREGCSDYLTKDELTKSAFDRAVTNALQKSRLTTEVQHQTFRHAEVEAVLEHFATQCACDIKPVISRLMAQIATLGAMARDNDVSLTDQLDEMEASCVALWGFARELERYQADELISRARQNDDGVVTPFRRPEK